MENKKASYLFEVSWEICNKVGGIYTVVKSKTQRILEIYQDRYFQIGPYFRENAATEFTEEPPTEEFKEIFSKLKNEGIVCHYGKQIRDSVNTILIDFKEFFKNKNNIKTKLWEDFKVDSLTAGHDFDEPAIWATSVGKLLELFHYENKKEIIVAQFHEWLSGAALLYLKKNKVRIATVFTTHATMLGRTLTGSGIDLYNVITKINPTQEAYKYGIQAKHQVEEACSLHCDVFTTVSEITALETKYILKKEPDLLLPNGLDLERFHTFEEGSIKHKENKEKIKEFLTYYFLPYYHIDLDNILFYFIIGRYEFRNKGIDILIKSLGNLNQKLKKEKTNINVITFFFIPSDIKGVKIPLLENKTFYADIEHSVDAEISNIRQKIIYSIVSKKMPDTSKLFDQDFLIETNRKILGFSKEGSPLLVTHNLNNEQNDSIINGFKEANLNNEKSDKVKVIFYPHYLTGSEGLLDLPYYDAISGCHLGIFPSYYEPWGYTPLETGASGVVAITTDLAGFGRFIEKNKDESNKEGIFVMKRYNKGDDEAVRVLADYLYKFTLLPRDERIKLKIQARNLASLADWKNLVINYIKAYNLAIEKAYKNE